MKIRIVLSLSALLFLGTFFEVDSSSSSETSSPSSTYPAEFSSSRSRRGKEPVKEHTERAESSSTRSRRDKKPVEEPTEYAESSSRISRKRQEPVDESEYKEWRSGIRKLYEAIMPGYRSGSETAKKYDSKKHAAKTRKLEEVKAQMKKLYEELALRQQEFGIACAIGNDQETIARMRENVEEVKRSIVKLRPLLCMARGMKTPENLMREYRILCSTFNKFDLQRRMAKARKEPFEGTDKMMFEYYKDKKDEYEKMLPHYKKPELIDGDIVPPGFKVPD